MIAVLAVQVRQQEQQWNRQRPENNPGNPCPAFEAASSTLGNSTGNINRADRSDRQQRGENLGVEINIVVHRAGSDAALRRAYHGVGRVATGRQGAQFRTESLRTILARGIGGLCTSDLPSA